MTQLRVLVADDEMLMCHELKCIIEEASDAQVVAICNDGSEVLRLCEAECPDVIFLDIQMPGQTGLEVASKLAGKADAPLVVFATAYDEYALQAFHVNAADYILKPFDEKEIARVLEKAQSLIATKKASLSRQSQHENVRPASPTKKFCVDADGKFEIIDTDDVQLIFARERLVYLQTVKGEIYNSKFTLNDFETRLDPSMFFRCHRNYIVNINRIKHISSWFNRGYLLTLKGEAKTEIPVSRAYAKRLRQFFQLL